MLLQNRSIDLLDSLIGGEGNIKARVEGHETRIHLVITTRRCHRPDVLSVDNLTKL
jgi:hypothetical protein